MKIFTWRIFLCVGLMLFASSYVAAQQQTVTGKVTDAVTNEPIIGGSVKIKGTNTGASTDLKGEFKLTASPGNILLINYLGYKTIEIPVVFGARMQIKLRANPNELNEVVVVGYGTQRKATLTGAVSTVDAKVFQDRGPIANPLQALQGQVPGVTVTRTGAQPGREGWNFQVRGATSVNGANPLIIVDGIALASNEALNSINPNDIANISFLKDAAAAIYGARAAFGVVLITTKRAAAGKFTIQYDGNTSVKKLGLFAKLLTVDEYGRDYKQALLNANYGVPQTNSIWYQLAQQMINRTDSMWFDVTKLPNGTNAGSLYNGLQVPQFGDVKDFTFFDTNPQDILWQNAFSQQHNLSFSGRNERVGYRVSLGYTNEGSQLKWGNNGNTKYNVRIGNDFTFSPKVKLETNVSLEKNDIFQPTRLGDVTGQFSQPGFPVASRSGKPYAWGTQRTPQWLAELGGDNKEYNTRVFTNMKLTYNIVKNLSFVGTAGYNGTYTDFKSQQKAIQWYSYNDTPLDMFPSAGGNSGGNNTWYQRSFLKDPYYNLIGYFEYHNTFKQNHDFALTAGSSYERDELNSYNTRTYNLGNDNIPSLGLGLSNSTAGFVTNTESASHYALGSYFSRLNYAYKGKYLLEALARYDGSSKFSADNRWKLFYGFSGGWRISEEPFMKQQKVVNELKLRASWGQVGNQGGIGLYDYIDALNVNSNQAFLGTSPSVSVTTSGNLVSLNRTWETIQNQNLALDFGFLNNRLTGTVEYFVKKNINMLVNQTYPDVLGARAPADNAGSLRTRGWEASLGWTDKIGSVSYRISGNISDSRNKLESLRGGTPLNAGGFYGALEGYPINSYFGLVYNGRIQTQAELDAYNNAYANSSNNIGLPIPVVLPNNPAYPAGTKSGAKLGDNKFKDVNGDGKLTTPGDLIYLGTDDPRYVFGLNLGLTWKGIDFSAILQGVGKRTIFRSGNWRTPFQSAFQGQPNFYVDKTWTPSNPDAQYPLLQQGGTNTYNWQISDWAVEDGSYVRLKNLVVGYTLPQKWMDRIKAVQKIRIYFSGNDLAEISSIRDGWDPEATRSISGGGGERFPFYRYLTAGLTATF